MLKLALRFLSLTVLLVAAFLVFAEEPVVAGLILSTIFVSVVALARGQFGSQESPDMDMTSTAGNRRRSVNVRPD